MQSKPKLTQERLLGMLVGSVLPYVMVYEVDNAVLTGEPPAAEGSILERISRTPGSEPSGYILVTPYLLADGTFLSAWMTVEEEECVLSVPWDGPEKSGIPGSEISSGWLRVRFLCPDTAMVMLPDLAMAINRAQRTKGEKH